MGGLWLAQGSSRGSGASGQGIAGALVDHRGGLGFRNAGEGGRGGPAQQQSRKAMGRTSRGYNH